MSDPKAASSADADAAIKQRIISHMNKDHTGELELYLRAFNGLSASAASRPELLDISLDGLVVRSRSGTSHRVGLDPPLASLAGARVRLVEMAGTAIARLGLSDIKVDRFAPPAGADWVVFAAVAFYFTCAATLAWVRPGTAAWSFLDAVFPFGGAEAYRWLVKAIFVPTLAIHVTEMWWMARTRLAKHRVPVGSRVWCLWLASLFFEGVMAFNRFDRLVETERQKKAAQKH